MRVVPLTLAAIVMLAARAAWTGSSDYLFLAWNLALAWIPLALAHATHASRRSPLALASALAWLLFLPNAIYLVTDLVHVRGAWPMRILDATMLGAFALAGAAIAIESLERMRSLVASIVGVPASWTLAAIVWLACGVGVWLGRVRRWNSWDAVIAPVDVVRDLACLVVAPRAHLAAWALMLACAMLLAALHVGAAGRRAP